MTGHQYFLKQTSFKQLGMLLVVLLVGCQASKLSENQIEKEHITHEPIKAPGVELSKQLLTQILTAEIAIRNNQYELAVDQLMLAAQDSADPRLASKTTYWALQSGLYEKAKQASELWLKLLDNQPSENLTQAQLAQASSFLELSQPAQALVIYRQIIKDSQDQDIYKRIAGEMSRLKNSENLIDSFRILVDETNDLENSNVGLAVLAARLNNFELSRKAVDQALQANPVNQDAALIKLSYLFEDQIEEEIVSFANAYLKRNPDANKLRMEYARYLSSHSESQKAIQQFEKVASSDQSLFEEVTLSIIALATQGEDYSLADKKLAILLEEDPTDNRLIFYRCQTRLELKDYQLANELCSEINFGQYYFPAQLELADIMAAQNELDAALMHLENIPVSGTEEQIRVYMRQQGLLHLADELERAVAVLDNALKKYNDNTSLLYARGLILSELGQVNDHERDMRRLIKLEPENAHAYNALGYTLADLTSRYDEALELIQKAVELEPEDAYILDSLGWVYFKLNKLDQAKIHLEQAFDLSGDAEIAAHLGELYWVLGDKSRAKSVWSKAKKLTPDNKALNQALERFL